MKNAASLAKQYGAIVVDINAHGMLNGQPPEYYRDLEQKELRNYWTQGTDDRDKFYFVGMYVRLLRSVEFIAAQEAVGRQAPDHDRREPGRRAGAGGRRSG